MDITEIIILIGALVFGGALIAVVIDDRKKASQHEPASEPPEPLLGAEAETQDFPGRDTQPGPQSPAQDFTPDQEEAMSYITRTIRQLGCQPEEVDGNKKELAFKFQGEEFHIEYNGIYLRLWDPVWLRIKTDNPDFPRMIRAVNETNFGFGPTVVFTNPSEEGYVFVHSRYDIYYPYFADNDYRFIAAALVTFFETKRNFANSLKSNATENFQTPNPFELNPISPSAN